MNRTIPACLALLAFTGSAPATATDRNLPSRAGAVAFSHERHSGVEGGCIACHHTSRPGDRMPACRTCHAERGDEILSAPAALHASCIGCHDRLRRAGAPPTGPSRRCSGCHAPRR